MAVKIVVYPYRPVPPRRQVPGPRGLGALLLPALLLFLALLLPFLAAGNAGAATPCDNATRPGQCAWVDAGGLPPFVHDAILAKGGTFGTGNVLILGSGDPLDPDTEISNDVGQPGCGTNPDGWETYDCTLLGSFVPPQDSVVLALSSEWFEWYQTIFTDWMTISGAGVPTVDVSINSWINNKVDIIPYGPWDTGVVLLTSLSAQKMVDFRVADSGDHIYDTDIVVVPASWFSGINQTGTDPTLLCGDGKLEPGEECDDGNNVADDGCSNLCLGSQPAPSTPPVASTCGNLKYTWPTGTTAPYTCGSDLCAGFRCVVGDTISPACYTAAQCAAACAGSCVDIQTAQLDCSTMCKIQPPATQPPPPLPQTCSLLKVAWPDGTTAPYACDDACQGQRCLTGVTISPECYAAGECAGLCSGTCVDVPAADCNALCALAVLPTTCTPAEQGQTRTAQNQNGPCQGNLEVCNSSGQWVLTSGSFHPDDEKCNGIDDDCNGAVDDMFVTCGDPGLCQNTVNKCDPANPSVPVACQTLPPPSPVEICNNGLDDDCDGAADDGCECGDGDCMPGEDWFHCPQDCTTPPMAGTLCSDGNACTEGDYWSGGVCMPGAPVDCTGGNACLVAGACDPATGCSATKLDCNDWIDCTADGCDSVSGCFHTPSDAACDDGDPCTLDTCDVATGCLHDVIPACASTDADADGYASVATGGADCDDANAAVNPGAAEVCNGIDDNCDAQVDEGWAVGNACDSAPNACGQTAPGLLVCGADTVSVVCDAATPGLPTGYGGACQSVGNACGQTNSGTVDCAGACGALPPADPAGYGNACTSAANSCGETAAGTIQCDGSCSAVTPANPAGYGDACSSATNSCGETAAGTIQCNGSCSAVTPANPAGYGDACASAANNCGETAAGTIQCDGSCSAVTPANPAGYGDACTSAANNCGETAPGTIQCNGSCSAVTPANPAGYGDACASAANSCGETATGTIQCNGSCSAVTPANPAGYGDACSSVANSCGGTASGTIQCNGSCSAVTPANPAGYGDACSSAANSCGETAAGTIQCNGSCSAVTPANPAGYGDACASGANSCGETAAGTVQCNGSCSAVTPANPAGYGDACASGANSCGETAAGTIQCNGSCSAVTPANPAGYGDACASAANSCGETAAGTTQCDGSCSAVTPANPPGYGDACASAANSCGETAAGTIQCSGSCSAVTPANPAGYGDACSSAANSCGETAAGTIQCSGSCSAVTPANPAGYGDACSSAANSCGETAAGTIECDGSCSAATPPNPLGYGDECDSAPNACGETAVGTQQCDGSCDAAVPAVVDTDADGVPDCLDGCPSDPAKTAPDSCGCGVADTDANNNGTIDCLESTKADVGITAELLSKVIKPNKRVRIRWEFTNHGPDRVTPGMLIEGSLTGGPFSEVRLPTGCAGIPEDFACETDVFLAGRAKAMKLGVISASGTSAHLVLKVSSPLVDPDLSNQTATVDYTVP